MGAWIWLVVGLGLVMVILLIGQSAWRPLRWVGYGLFKIALGAILLFVFNSFGTYYDFTIPINPVTAAMSGFLGLPGLVSLTIIKAFLI